MGSPRLELWLTGRLYSKPPPVASTIFRLPDLFFDVQARAFSAGIIRGWPGGLPYGILDATRARNMSDTRRELESPIEGLESSLGGKENLPPSPSAPVNVDGPTIFGPANVGNTLTSDRGGWTGYPYPTFTYQWRQNGLNISGETGTTYVVRVGDIGQNITLRVTATNSEGSAGATSNTLVGAGGGEPAYLKEDGETILLETGSRMLLEA
jgi:hypothetical protein